MTIVVGDRVKNKLTQDLFKITKIENERVVMLEDEKRARPYMVSETASRIFF